MLRRISKDNDTLILDNAPVGIFRSSLDGTLLYVNLFLASMLQYETPEEMLASIKDINSFIKGLPQNLNNVIKTEKKLTSDIICKFKRGGEAKASLCLQFIEINDDRSPAIEGYIGNSSSYLMNFQRDTELQQLNQELSTALQQLMDNEVSLKQHYNILKRREEALTAIEERLNYALEASGTAVWDWDIKNNKTYRSSQYKSMRGYEGDEIGDDFNYWLNSIHPDDRDRVTKGLNQHLDGTTHSYSMEYRTLCKDGSYIWIREEGRVMVRDSEGEPARMLGTHFDITERVKFIESINYHKNLFKSLFNNSPYAIALFDHRGNVIEVNTPFTNIFGYSFDEARGRYINDLIDPDKKLVGYGASHILDGLTFTLEDQIRYNKLGQPMNMTVKGAPVYDNGKIIGGYAIYTDIRNIKLAEGKIKLQHELLESLFKYSPDALVFMDMEGNILHVNHKFEEIFGYTDEECKGKQLNELIIDELHMEEAKDIHNAIKYTNNHEFQLNRKHKNGDYRAVRLRGGPTYLDGEAIGYHAIYTDITEQRAAEEKIRYLSYHDKLTGLYNRAYFEETLEELEAKNQFPLAIIIGDVNGLKLVNDVFGHFEGDQLLIKISDILKKACRSQDIVCRWGGDEFAILLPNSDEGVARAVCEEIYRQRNQLLDQPIRISISTGFSVKYNKISKIQEIIKEAEEKMYRNKLMEETSIRNNIITSLQKSLFERSHETEEHAQRMKKLAEILGRSLGLDSDKMAELSLLAIIHDIGKIAISDTILCKPGKLTPAEWEEMKKHTEIGYRIAISTQELMHVAKYVLFHHERWDGMGYPQGLKDYEIPLLSRIIAIVDAYDVMTHARAYKEPISSQDAINEIIRCSGSQFDPKIVEKFVEIYYNNLIS